MTQQININIDIKQLTRVEGHGNIIVNVSNGKLEQCQWQVGEAPRFFEAMVRGRHYSEVPRITSRICGICSIGHTLAAVKATEKALGIVISEQSYLLRLLVKHAENFDSHILHVYLLAAPDLLGAKSFYPLLKSHNDVIKCALKLKQLGHEWGSLIAGRTTHPTTIVPGGLTKIPSHQNLVELKQKLESVLPDIEKTVDTLFSLRDQLPEFNRATEYIALSDAQSYSIYDGDIQSLSPDIQQAYQRQTYPVSEYLSITNEFVNHWSTAKYCKNKLDSYMVGALARLNINQAHLHPKAKQVLNKFQLNGVVCNPYKNTLAQVVELVNDIYSSIEIIDDLLSLSLKPEPLISPKQFSSGIAAVEVPRGILFHDYSYDTGGLCTQSNFIIPTNQNHANIQKDFETLVPLLLEQNKNQQEIELALEMLVRAYDPCISCSAHFLKVEFVQ